MIGVATSRGSSTAPSTITAVTEPLTCAAAELSPVVLVVLEEVLVVVPGAEITWSEPLAAAGRGRC